MIHIAHRWADAILICIPRRCRFTLVRVRHVLPTRTSGSDRSTPRRDPPRMLFSYRLVWSTCSQIEEHILTVGEESCMRLQRLRPHGNVNNFALVVCRDGNFSNTDSHVPWTWTATPPPVIKTRLRLHSNTPKLQHFSFNTPHTTHTRVSDRQHASHPEGNATHPPDHHSFGTFHRTSKGRHLFRDCFDEHIAELALADIASLLHVWIAYVVTGCFAIRLASRSHVAGYSVQPTKRKSL